VLADFCLDAVELFLENGYLLDRLEVEIQLVSSEALDLVVSQ
jgi:hypothetical protein